MGGYILDAWSVLRVEGRDARDLLHRLLSCNIQTLAVGQVIPGTLLKANGKLVAYFQAYGLAATAIGLVTPSACVGELQAALDRLVFTEAVQFEREATEVLTVVGPEATRLWALEPGQQQVRSLTGLELRLAALGSDRFQLWVAAADRPALEAALQAAGLPRLAAADYASFRIQRGLPEWDWELDASVVPIGLRLDQAFDHHKGCYTGQEVVSNMTYVTHPPHILLGLKVQGTPATGSKARLGDTTVGTVTTSAPGLALLRARWERLQPGDQVVVESDGQLLPAEVVSLPMPPA